MFLRQSRHLFLLVISFSTITVFLTYYKEPVTQLLEKSPLSKSPSSGLVEHKALDPHNITKMLVVASQKKDDTKWIDELLPDWDYVRYLTDEPRSKFNVPMNKGNEAMVYLTYIINHYHDLPDLVVFIHGERFQWHNDDPFWDAAWLLQHLQITHVLSRPYTNLRCVWTLGCPSDLKGINQPWPTYLDPTDEHLKHHLTFQYAVAFTHLFPHTPIPPHVSVPCCAQFAVPRSSILRRPLAQHVATRAWLLDTKLENDISGRVFEFAWHIMFGAKAFECPNAEGCYCDLYGICDLNGKVLRVGDDGEGLSGCERERCGDRWDFPPDGFPKGWPEVGWEGQRRSIEDVERLRGLGRADIGIRKNDD